MNKKEKPRISKTWALRAYRAFDKKETVTFHSFYRMMDWLNRNYKPTTMTPSETIDHQLVLNFINQNEEWRPH